MSLIEAKDLAKADKILNARRYAGRFKKHFQKRIYD